MTYDETKTNLTAAPQERCDIRVWSGDCQQSSYTGSGGKYLCASCETISSLDHEVHHEIFPHISGDEKNLY